MRLIDLKRTGPDSFAGPITLDELHEVASRLGTVEIGHLSGQYVEIFFRRHSGSMVYARGKHSDIREAYRLAIEEAKALGAQP